MLGEGMGSNKASDDKQRPEGSGRKFLTVGRTRAKTQRQQCAYMHDREQRPV
jgi:hypothetical protein